MTARLIDGNALSKQIRADVAQRAATLTERGQRPGLAVILVGDDPASQVYVRNKVKACHDTGLHSVFDRFDAGLPEAALLARIAALNADPAIHGILVQMPLPKHIDPHKVIEAISPEKDVDGYSVLSAGHTLTGAAGFRPCTPFGCMKLIESTGRRPAWQTRRRHRPQQHRRQADGAAAFAGQRHRHHLPQCDGGHRAPHPAGGRGRRGGRPAQHAARRHGQARRDRHRRRHQPRRPPASSAAMSTTPRSPKWPRPSPRCPVAWGR